MLAPYLEALEPTHTHNDGTREINMFCPLHEDSRRSASINVDKGLWYCQAGCGGGRITDLIRRSSEWVEPGKAAQNGHARSTANKPTRVLTEGMIGGWHSALLSNEPALQWLRERRGLSVETVQAYEIGFYENRLYTIPVRSPEGEIWNVRYYNPQPQGDARKIWGEKGYNSPPRLYPIMVFDADPDEVIICEGEWDAMLALQNGYMAVTRTGAADVWHSEWGQWFKDRVVYICHDRDEKGDKANRTVARALEKVADVRIVELPYPLRPKHGQDLTDFLLDHDPADLQALLNAAPKYGAKEEHEVETVTVLDTFDSRRVGRPVKVITTVKGRKEPGYTIPKKVRLVCTQDAGTKCAGCPMRAANGEAVVEISADNPDVLAMLDSPSQHVAAVIAGGYGVPGAKCTRLQQEVEEAQAVEILYGRPALDYSDGSAGDHKTIKITSVGRHDTGSNLTIEAVGALQPSPFSQKNEFLAHEISPLETSVDKFDLNGSTVKLMKLFQTNGPPLKKVAEISRVLAENVTHINGRPEMHALMDITFHSVLGFTFAGEDINRGWLESLIIGDTGTGKSTAARRLVQHYNAGEIINCEAATFAGVVGGVQQLGGKDWIVTWGAMPINDKRLVVLDECGGLSPEEIASMSDVRSSGQAKLQKVVQDSTWARTRSLWMGNPRNSTMERFTYGVDALAPLIGNAEDVARFDMAMAVTKYDVPSELINLPAEEHAKLRYDEEACHTLLMWVWSRKPEQVFFQKSAENLVLKHANDLGKVYIEDPPLILASSVRIKLARVAAAIAARLFSTDDKAEKVIVKPEHVNAAVQFLNLIYGMQAFGYRERSKQVLSDRLEAEHSHDEIEQYLLANPELAKYMSSGISQFRRQDLEEILNVSRDYANSIINTLWGARMVRKEKGDIRVQPALHALLRRIKL